ncbi:MAG: GNAT family N-acetyltransferase [Chloroflexota bacterium]
MADVSILPATEVDFGEFTRALNESYKDYYVPLNMDVAQLRDNIARYNTVMSASQVATVDGNVVGLGMLAQRGKRGWIGGVGVIEGYRRQGIGRQLMHGLLAAAREIALETVQLEVIMKNTRARSLYDSLGFEAVRTLHVAEGYARFPSEDYRFQEVRAENVFKFFDAFHTTPLPWQRERVSIESLANKITGMVALNDDGVQAFALGIFRLDVIRYVDLAHAPGQREALKALVGEIHRQNPVAGGSIINIGEDDPAWSVLLDLGYQPYLSQHEMMLKLA